MHMFKYPSNSTQFSICYSLIHNGPANIEKVTYLLCKESVTVEISVVSPWGVNHEIVITDIPNLHLTFAVVTDLVSKKNIIRGIEYIGEFPKLNTHNINVEGASNIYICVGGDMSLIEKHL